MAEDHLNHFVLVIGFSHAGDEDDVFGSVLQSCQFGDLVELLFAHFSMWKNIKQAFTVVWQDLNRDTNTVTYTCTHVGNI